MALAYTLSTMEAMPVNLPTCHLCGEIMRPVPGAPGTWRDSKGHELLTSDGDVGSPPEGGGQARRPAAGTYQAQSVVFPQAAALNRDHAYMRTLIEHCGWFGQIGWVPQASQAGDGRLGHGPAERSSGSKSSRKRKKPKKTPKPLEEYGQ